MVKNSGLPDSRPVLGVGIHPVTEPVLVQVLADWARSAAGVTRTMFYANAHVLNLVAEDRAFAQAMARADVVIPEGWGSVLAARLAGVRLPEQLATMDWMDRFLAELAASNASIYLLGDEPGVARACGELMTSRHPGLRLAGAHHGFWRADGVSDHDIVQQIRQRDVDVLMVGLGNPLQEIWIDEHRHQLPVPLILSLGAMFRWYSGTERRAPRWLRRLHLEWLLRLAKHPIRHFRRYVIGNPRLIARALRTRPQQRAS